MKFKTSMTAARMSVATLTVGMTILLPAGVLRAETSPSPSPTMPPVPTMPTVPAMPTMPDIQWMIASQRIAASYSQHTNQVAGSWYSYVAVADQGGRLQPAVEDQADTPVWAYSVNKLAVALTVLDKIDRGELSLGQKLELTPDIIATGSGIYHLQTVYGDNLTLANLMTAMLMTSDNTAVRMLSKVASGAEINETLVRKGFTATHVDPIPDSRRFYLGQTTPREITRLLQGLADHTLVSESSSTFVLNILRWVNGYNDGVRRNMSSLERAQVATKYGAFEDSRHEVGIMFDAQNKPAAVYAFMNEGLGDTGNYGSTNPAVEAEAAMGREIFDIVNNKWATGTGRLVP